MFDTSRQSGVLMHISSLPGPFGVGVLGKEALDFIDLISQLGFKVWQILPLNPIDEFYSPYKSSSAFAGNYIYIDPRSLKGMGLVTQDEIDICLCQSDESKANYEFAYEKRLALLRIAYSRVTDTLKISIDEFSAQNQWVEPYALYCALKDYNNGEPWWKWDFGFDDYEFCKRQHNKFLQQINFYKFVQYIFFTQWIVVKSYANSKGIKIMGDMPFYVSMDSADVWSNTYCFQIDENTYKPVGVSGVPPDYFSSDGQLWGNPLYNWQVLEDEGYSWWLSRIAFLKQNLDIVRIDHFRAFSSYWSVDPESETARNGKWEKGPGEKFINILNNLYPDISLVAEDLGDIDNDVRTLLKSCNIPGMRVLQFGFEDMNDSIHLVHNYPTDCIAYIGTHDSNTFVGFINELSPEKRQYTFDYIGYCRGEYSSNACHCAIETLWRSSAALTIVTVQDMLGLYSESRMNTPGKTQGNWLFRITQDELNSIDRNYFIKLNNLFRR